MDGGSLLDELNMLTPMQFATLSGENRQAGFKFIGKGYCSTDPDKSTVQALRRVCDLQSLMRVQDMGSGVMVIDIPNIPENNIKVIKKRMELLLYDPSLFPDYNHPDIEVGKLRGTCLGKRDCYVGLYKIGTLRGERYCIVIKSYHTLSAMMFQRSVAESFEKIRVRATSAEEFSLMVNDSLSGKKYVENDLYREVQKKAFKHRLSVAKYVFRKLGVALPCPPSVAESRRLREGGAVKWFFGGSSGFGGSNKCGGDNVVFPISCLSSVPNGDPRRYAEKVFGNSFWVGKAEYSLAGSGLSGENFMEGRTEDLGGYEKMDVDRRNHAKADYRAAVEAYFSVPDKSYGKEGNWKDYPVVFLSVGSHDTVLVFNNLYTKEDFVNGAPYGLQPWIGFNRYGVEPEKQDENIAQIQDLGCPMGVNVDRTCRSLDFSEEDEKAMNERVRWRSQIDLSYAISPNYYGDDEYVDKVMKNMENGYNLGRTKISCQTMLLLMTPPIEAELDLVDFYDFGREDVLHISLSKFSDLVRVYSEVLVEWDSRFKQFGISTMTLDYYPPVGDFAEAAHVKYGSIMMMNKLPRLLHGFAWGHGCSRKLWAYYNEGEQFMNRKVRELYGVGDPVDMNGILKRRVKEEYDETGGCFLDEYGIPGGNSDTEVCNRERTAIGGKEKPEKLAGSRDPINSPVATIGDSSNDPETVKILRKELGMVLYVHSFFMENPVEALAEKFRSIKFIESRHFYDRGIETDYATDIGEGELNDKNPRGAASVGGTEKLFMNDEAFEFTRQTGEMRVYPGNADGSVIEPVERIENKSRDYDRCSPDDKHNDLEPDGMIARVDPEDDEEEEYLTIREKESSRDGSGSSSDVNKSGIKGKRRRRMKRAGELRRNSEEEDVEEED